MKLLHMRAQNGGKDPPPAHAHLCAADILDFELAGRPGFDWDMPDGAYWPALMRWLRKSEKRG